MKDQLGTKINDYCNYVNLAVRNFKTKNYSDSAHNARKAAEAICKIILYNAFSIKVAENKITGRSLRELITQINKDQIASKEAINHIENLQLIGNRAAHDNIITKDEAAHSLNALNLLTEYLFEKNLKIATPSALNFDNETKKETEVKQPEVIEKIIVQEKIIQQKLDKETEEALFRRIKDLTQAEREKHEALLDRKQEEFYEKKINEEQQHSDKLKNQAVKRKRQRWNVGMACSVILALTAIVLVLMKSNEPIESVTETPLNKHADTTYVAINKLDILQDNPQMDFKVESYLNSCIISKVPKNASLPIKIIHSNFKISGFSNKDSILNHADKLGFDVVYFGNFYESALDSNILEINGHFVKDRTYFRAKKIKFKNLTDSSFIKEMNDQANIPAMYYATSNHGKKPYPEIIKVLDPLTCYSKENYQSIKGYMASMKLFIKDSKEALNVFNELLKINPVDASTIKHKAIALTDLKMFDSAQVYFDKLFEIDKNNIEALIQYAYLLLQKNEKKLATEVLNQILSLDQNNKTAKDWLSKLKFSEIIRNSANDPGFKYVAGLAIEKHGDYKAALISFKEAYLLNPAYKDVKARIAKCYFELGDKSNALKFGYEAVKQDSANITNTFLYASLLAQVTPENKSKVMRYYNLSVKNDPHNLAMLQMYAEYLRLHNEYKKCIEVCELAKQKYPYDIKIIRLLGGCYLVLQDYNKAKPLYEFMCTIESDNVETMVILANCYLNTCPAPNAEFRKGVNSIETALALDPKNGVVQLVYARYMQRLNRLEEAKEHYLKAKILDKEIKDSNLETLLSQKSFPIKNNN